MQPIVQQTPFPPFLRQEDISTIIKHFSFTIQQRFEEIQKNCNYFTCLNSINYEKSDLQKDILHRYNDYKTSNQHQIKLLQKFVERIIQIFQFFRQKTQEPQILQTMGDKIADKLKQILKNQNNYHFFVNNRPKTHSTNVKPLGSRSSSNDFLSIVGPACKQQLDLQAIIINNSKKVKAETHEKKCIQVGKLFKYVFSVLKRGYLIKLRMQKQEKKIKGCAKDLSCIDENMTISVEGTCAILRNGSQKGNKQNRGQIEDNRMFSSGKQKLSAISNNYNKKQFYIYQKTKNRSSSTNQYLMLSKQNPLIMKQSVSKLRQLDKKVSLLYEILNVEKYCIVRVAKDTETAKKDQIKRNSWVETQCKKYQINYNRWVHRLSNSYLAQGQQSPNQYLDLQFNQKAGVQNSQNQQNQSKQDLTQEIHSSDQSVPIIGLYLKQIQQKDNYDVNPFQDTQQPERKIISKSIKTQQNESLNIENYEKPLQSVVHTIIVCSSRNYDLKDSALADKSSNLMDLDKNDSRLKDFKSKSVKQDRKSLRLNLPSMLGDKSNLMNEPIIRLSNLTNQQRNHKLSQKSQYYLYNYHIGSADDGSFVPLLPKKEKNTENIHEYKNEVVSIKRKNLVPNFHPLNRCRIFREKKINRSSNMIQGYEVKISGLDESILKGRLRNIIL